MHRFQFLLSRSRLFDSGAFIAIAGGEGQCQWGPEKCVICNRELKEVGFSPLFVEALLCKRAPWLYKDSVTSPQGSREYPPPPGGPGGPKKIGVKKISKKGVKKSPAGHPPSPGGKSSWKRSLVQRYNAVPIGYGFALSPGLELAEYFGPFPLKPLGLVAQMTFRSLMFAIYLNWWLWFFVGPDFYWGRD